MSLEQNEKPKGVGLLRALLGAALVGTGGFFFVFRGNIGTEYTQVFEFAEGYSLTLSATLTEVASILTIAIGLLVVSEKK